MSTPTPYDPPKPLHAPSGPPPTYIDALKTIQPVSDLQKLPSIPCARYALLFGIVAGTSVGCLRFLFNRRGGGRANATGWDQAAVAANWAVGAWGAGSLGAWHVCRRRQSEEAARMQALVAEIKARRDAGARPKKQRAAVGGVLIGDKGREILSEKERERDDRDRGGVEGAEGGRPWYRRWV